MKITLTKDDEVDSTVDNVIYLPLISKDMDSKAPETDPGPPCKVFEFPSILDGYNNTTQELKSKMDKLKLMI